VNGRSATAPMDVCIAMSFCWRAANSAKLFTTTESQATCQA